MGNHKIGKLLRLLAQKAIIERPYSYFHNKRIVIDLMPWLYKFKISMVKQDSANITAFLWSKINNMLTEGIIPIFVMDGTPPELKQGELNKRRKIKNRARQKIEELNNQDNASSQEMEKQLKRCACPSWKEINSSIKFIEALGFKVIKAPGEADPQCAGLYRIDNQICGVVSEDYDMLILGARMFTNFARSKTIKEFDYFKILSELDITSEQFIEIAIMLGCDYCDGVTILGTDSKTQEIELLFNKYKEYGSLEKMLKGLPKENDVNKKKKQTKYSQSMLNINGIKKKKNGGRIKYMIPYSLVNKWKEIKNHFQHAKIYDPSQINTKKWNDINLTELNNHLTIITNNDSNRVKKILKNIKALQNYYNEHGSFKRKYHKQKKKCGKNTKDNKNSNNSDNSSNSSRNSNHNSNNNGDKNNKQLKNDTNSFECVQKIQSNQIVQKNISIRVS
jgi:flap endonuclease-1